MPVSPRGLVRHKNGTYYLRLRIPTDLLAWAQAQGMGNSEVWKSLHTSEFTAAVSRFHVENGKLQATWTARRQQVLDFVARRHVQTAKVISELTPDMVDAIAARVEATALAGDEARRTGEHALHETGVEIKPLAYTYEEVEDYREGYVNTLPDLKAAVAVGNMEVLGRLCNEFLYLNGYESRLGVQDFKKLAIAYGRAAIRANEKLIRRYDGEEVPTPSNPTKTSPLFGDVVKDYLRKYPAKKQAAMFKKVSPVLTMALEVIGDRPVHTLRQSDFNRFFELVCRLPPRWKDEVRRRKVSIVALGEMGLGEPSKNTFDGTYLAVMAPFIRWCRKDYQDQGFSATISTEGVLYTGSRENAENHQRAFKLDELKRLFDGPEMARLGALPDTHHQFWLPYVGLLTGARVNELCQIHPFHDIGKDDDSGIWYFNITEETETAEGVEKAVKTETSQRKVPIHSRLIDMGFLDYVERLRRQGRKLLFSPFKPYNGRASGEAQKWFRGFMRELGLRDETPKAKLTGMHAFRSTFLNRAANVGAVNAEAITGHATSQTGLKVKQDGLLGEESTEVVRTYTGELDIAVKRGIIERIDWPELKFTPPITSTFIAEQDRTDGPSRPREAARQQSPKNRG